MSMEGRLVSIVIPVYNGGEYLSDAIESALNQTYRQVEVLVVNDGSKDDGRTQSVAMHYGNSIHYYLKANGGVSSALNYGIRRMTGFFFSWLSHDDVYYPQKVEREIEYLKSVQSDRTVVYSDFDFIDGESRALGRNSGKHIHSNDFQYENLADPQINGCTALIPGEVFGACGLFDERLRTCQDHEFFYRASKSFRFCHIQEALVGSRVHEAQGSRTMAAIAHREARTMYDGIVTDYLARHRLESNHRKYRLAVSMTRFGYYEAATRALVSMQNLLSEDWPRLMFGAIFMRVRIVIKHLRDTVFQYLKRILVRVTER
jgi:glycosyltransferase involved in cell wall biosynthesis